MCCDYRVMASKYRIGLNEVQLGIAPPFWFSTLMEDTVGKRQSDRLLQLGLMVPAKDALTLGLVDRTVDTEDEVLPAAREELAKFARIHPAARAMTKRAHRASLMKEMTDRKEEDIQHFIKFITQDEVQKSLKAYLSSLRSKSTPKE